MEIIGIIGMSFGILGFVFGLAALSKLTKLEQRLKDAGIH